MFTSETTSNELLPAIRIPPAKEDGEAALASARFPELFLTLLYASACIRVEPK